MLPKAPTSAATNPSRVCSEASALTCRPRRRAVAAGNRAYASNYERDRAARRARLVEVAVDRRRRSETYGIGPARGLQQLPFDAEGMVRYASTASTSHPASASPRLSSSRAPAAWGRKTWPSCACGWGRGRECFEQAFGQVAGRDQVSHDAIGAQSLGGRRPDRRHLDRTERAGVGHQFEDSLYSVRGGEHGPGIGPRAQLRYPGGQGIAPV